MKTKSGMKYGYIPGSPRLIDLAERLVPVLNEWAQDNLPEGDRLDVMLLAGVDEVPHRITTVMEKTSCPSE